MGQISSTQTGNTRQQQTSSTQPQPANTHQQPPKQRIPRPTSLPDGPSDFETITTSLHFPHNLSHHHLTDETAKLIANNCPDLVRVKTLILSNKFISLDGIISLIQSPHLTNVQRIRVTDLKKLGDHNHHDGEDDPSAPPKSTNPSLTKLYIGSMYTITPAQMTKLCNLPQVANLTDLAFSFCLVDDDIVTAIVQSVGLKSLESLCLGWNTHITSSGCKSIPELKSKSFPNLKEVVLSKSNRDSEWFSFTGAMDRAGIRVLVISDQGGYPEVYEDLKERRDKMIRDGNDKE